MIHQILAAGFTPASFSASITTNQQEMNLATWASSNGWNGSSAATITINSGVYIWSDNTATPALTTGSFPGGLTLINNGYIMGKGGRGGGWGSSPEAGGPAISLGSSVSVNNTSGYIGGGGGGGGGSGFTSEGNTTIPEGGGGGAGGGDGGDGYSNSWAYGGAGGGLGSSGGGGGGLEAGFAPHGGGGGGRVFPSSTTAAGSVSGMQFQGWPGIGGSGGGSGTPFNSAYSTAFCQGGSGGGPGVVGGIGSYPPSNYQLITGGGGGWGAAGGNGSSGYLQSAYAQAGAAGGKAIALNGYSVTWLSGTSQVYGAVS
jgi:hypothetical protein